MMNRRELMLGGTAGLAMLSHRAFAQSPTTGKITPWADQPVPVPAPAAAMMQGITRWEDLDCWITPSNKFFGIGHYGWPTIDEKTWKLNVIGSVFKPASLTMAEIKALPRKEVISTIECAGSNGGLPFFTSAIGNAKWAGASLADVLKAAQIKTGAVEVVFYGMDQGEDIVRKGTPYEVTYVDTFARSMCIEEAMDPANLLCYEMNGDVLPARNGFPMRLIAPGWYGVSNVKWLSRIEVRDTPYLGKFVGREYVTMRQGEQDGKPFMTHTPVGRMLLKSAPARVALVDGKYHIDGMAWGPDVSAVEVKIDDGKWTKATLDESQSPYSWRFWSITQTLTPGEHTVTSRAIDKTGNIQPTMDDPLIANKKTRWESNGQITRRVHIV